MKASLQIALFLLLTSCAVAQQNYFVYMQTDNKQPFYVKMNDKLMSSSASGYLVIPKLTSGNYSLAVGFPKNQWPEQNLVLAIGNTDAGYLLKNFGEKGWGLYNIQTMEISMNGAPAPVKNTRTDGDDIFTNTLAGAANTSLSVPERKPEPVVIQPVPPKPAEVPVTGSAIERIGGSSDGAGRSITYTDRTGSNIDTIRIFIPAAENNAAEAKTVAQNTEQVKTEPVKEKKFLDIELQNPNAKNADIAATVSETPAVPAKKIKSPAVSTLSDRTDKPVVGFNSDCKANATEEDFLKLRKKMASAANDDAMVSASSKFLKAKCYSTEQIKNLSALFLSDTGKYKFFDAAYPHTYDTQNFASLQSQLTDEYYVNRFRSMIRN